MIYTVNIGETIMGIGSSVASAFIYPKLLISSLILGTTVGSSLAIGQRIWFGKSITDLAKLTAENLQRAEPEQYKIGMTPQKNESNTSLIISLMDASFIGYLLYAYLTSRAVNPIFAFLGGLGTVLEGVPLGFGGSRILADKIIMFYDRRRLKPAQA